MTNESSSDKKFGQNDLPLVSILIPAFKPRWFEESLRTASFQDYPNFEILVYDNCPTEGIAEICQRYPEARYYRNPNKRFQNLVDLINDSRGRYIKILFDDDLLSPNCVSEFVKAMQLSSEVQMAFSSSYIINEESQPVGERKYFTPNTQYSLTNGNDLCRRFALNCSNMVGEFSTVMFDGPWLRENIGQLLIGKVSGRSFSPGGISDVISFINAAVNHPVAYVDQSLTAFRLNTESNSNPDNNPEFIHAIIDWRLIIEEISIQGQLSEDEEIFAKIRYNWFLSLSSFRYPKLQSKIFSARYSPGSFRGYHEYLEYEKLSIEGKEEEAFPLLLSILKGAHYWKIFQAMARIAKQNNDKSSACDYYYLAFKKSWEPIDDSLAYGELLIEKFQFEAALSVLEFFLKFHPKSEKAQELVNICKTKEYIQILYNAWCTQKTIGGVNETDRRKRIETLWKKRPLFELVLVLKPGQEGGLADSIDSIQQQYYDGWRLSIFAPIASPDPQFLLPESPVRWVQIFAEEALSSAIDQHLTQSTADWVGFVECGTQLAPQLFLNLGDYIALHPEWALIYTDEDRIAGTLFVDAQRSNPLFKPSFNLDLLRSIDYIGDLWVDRQKFLLAGGFSTCFGATKYDLILRIIDAVGEKAIGHIPDVLIHVPETAFHRAENTGAIQALISHFNRRQIHAEIQAGWLPDLSRRVLYLHPDSPKVSIIIPNKDRLVWLNACVKSLLKHTTYPNWELLIVDNDSTDPDVLTYYETLMKTSSERVRVLAFSGEFNYLAMHNAAAQAASGEYLLLLHSDTVCIHDDWLAALMNHAQRADVGIVGARLLYPDSLKIQHAGMIFGMNLTANHVFNNQPYDQPGYMARALVDQNYSAVAGACQLIRKALFRQVTEFSQESFPVYAHDMDLCLKVSQLGYRIVWTPFATLLHHGGAPKTMLPSEKQAEIDKEQLQFFQRSKALVSNDPAWNRNLSLVDQTPCTESELITSWDADFSDRLRILGLLSANQASAEHRQLSPLRMLHTQGHIHYTGVCPSKIGRIERPLKPAELARLAPSTLLIHSPIDNECWATLIDAKRYTPEIFRIYSLDDLISKLPKNHSLSKGLSADLIQERLEAGLKASQRMIVSTEPLKDAYRHLIDDIRVIPNALDPRLWGGVSSTLRHGKKLRVGWAGAHQHAENLRFILAVIQATHKEVDWVFFGMMPEGAQPYLAEFHAYGDNLAEYPAKLAALDLDLAIAPLEIHPFNEAKSNLRLLEYGILGWPVICSDILPYQTNHPPVIRLPNDPKRWIAAIRERINEPKTLAEEGKILQMWVKQNYLIDYYLDDWLKALAGNPQSSQLKLQSFQ